ncbi:enoyl-CoA hydratase [Nocardia sp. CA2R105]|uniref:MaoC/PaaZ C-terminal domain-containing protein n=1 Tax=Nocardia coffeae TaxID=2873381 RepID=UPI001CA6D896|nr:MaoC/PaaZ C-terminal domain-containing protein [Nocardia coffeae]MBY8856837.1 enoyl-CoA hydratase [Nocardia coffeae]
MLTRFAGVDLGTRRVGYTDRDVILYALAVGADADDLDLIFEDRLHVLPTFAMTLGLWAADAASAAGAFEPESALHGAQRLVVHRRLPPEGQFDVRGRVDAVWDKGRSAVLDIVAESEYFTATYSIFLPGQGGFGGQRGPARTERPAGEEKWTADIATGRDQAALYRLTGDRHLIHVDPVAAQSAGFPRPILHGLCTLGIVARGLAAAVDAQPWELSALSARFSSPVFPGDVLSVRAGTAGRTVGFDVGSAGATVLADGEAVFDSEGNAPGAGVSDSVR